LALIRSELEIAIRNREIRADIEPKVGAILLLGLIRGARSQWLLAPDSVDLSKMRRELLGFVRRSLVSSGSAGAAGK
jgi:hypothetical protein